MGRIRELENKVKELEEKFSKLELTFKLFLDKLKPQEDDTSVKRQYIGKKK